jgi:hypothetical protein
VGECLREVAQRLAAVARLLGVQTEMIGLEARWHEADNSESGPCN